MAQLVEIGVVEFLRAVEVLDVRHEQSVHQGE